jgi:hypothetical protein
MGSDDAPMKVIGRTGVQKGLVAANNLFKLVIGLRGTRPFIPKGIHRFESFEEAQQWSLQMMSSRPKHVLPP